MASVVEARKLAQKVWPGCTIGADVVDAMPGYQRAWAAKMSGDYGTMAVERIDCTATSRRAALAGLCAALSVLGEDKR